MNVVPPPRSKEKNSPLNRLFQMIIIKRECCINDLWELVGFESVSTRYEDRKELDRAIDWFLNRMLFLNVVAFSESMGMQIIPDTLKVIRMPKMILGVLNETLNTRTVLVYGNLDVEDAFMEDGWSSHPFLMTEMGNYLNGRGVALDKGPLMCWLNAIQAYRDAGLRLPVNIVFLIESMAHCGSLGLDTVLKERISFFREVSCVIIATRRWQTNQTPAIIFGSRGVVYYELEVQCANRPLSSCDHCGILYEALPDLFYLLSSLINNHLQVLFQQKPESLNMDRTIFHTTEFNYKEFGTQLEVMEQPHLGNKPVALAENWVMPQLSIHGIEGANAETDARFVIPNKVTGKFSVSLGPNQNVAETTRAIRNYLGEVWMERNSPNRMRLCEKMSVPPWTSRTDTPECDAAARAMAHTYQKIPNIIRDGGALLAPTLFQQHLNKNVLVLPIAKNDAGGAPINERISVENYIKGSQFLAAFMWEYGHQNKSSNKGKRNVSE